MRPDIKAPVATVSFFTGNHFSLFVLLLVVTVGSLPLIVYGPQTGGDFHLQLPWSHNFAAQVLSGDIYPRWLMNVNGGAGSPTFFYYGPVAFYFSVISNLLCGSCTASAQLGIAQYLILIAAAFSFFFYIRQYAGRWPSALAAVLYTFAPYHFSMDILYRQAHTEAAAYIWIPLVLLATDRLISGARAVPALAISYALLVLTHLPTALLGSFFLALYVLIKAWHRGGIRLYLLFSLSIALGLLLSACYLIPALFTQNYIQANLWWTPYFDYFRWFFLNNTPAPDATIEPLLWKIVLGNTIGFMAAGVLAMSAHTQQRRTLLAAAALFLGAWFFMTPISAFLWELIPVIKKVQFPWRAIVFQDFALATTAALALSSLGRSGRSWERPLGVILILALLAWAVTSAVAAYRPHQALWSDSGRQDSLAQLARTGVGGRPHLPAIVHVDLNSFVNGLPPSPATLFDRVGSVEVEYWAPRELDLAFNLQSSSLVTVKQIAYPGWEAIDSAGEPIPITPDPAFGLIQFNAHAGDYHVKLKLKPLWHEKIGWLATAFGMLVLLLLIYRSRK